MHPDSNSEVTETHTSRLETGHSLEKERQTKERNERQGGLEGDRVTAQIIFQALAD